MGKRGRRLTLSLLAFLVLLGTFLFIRLPKTLGQLELRLGAEIQERLGAELVYEEAQIRLAPFPELRIVRPRLGSLTGAEEMFSAERAEFFFRLFPLLWGQVRLSGFHLKGGKGTWRNLPVEQVELRVRGLQPKRSARYEWKGSVLGVKDSLQGKGELRFENPGSENFWEALGIQGDTRLKVPSLDAWPSPPGWLGRFSSPELLTRPVEGKFRVEKKEGSPAVQGEVQMKIGPLPGRRGGTQVKIGELSLEGNLLWEMEKHSLEVSQFEWAAPYGRLTGRGIFNLETGEMEEVRFIGREIVWEALIREIPFFQSLLPPATGLSGQTEFDLSLRGTPDYLSFHGNWNLTSSAVTYGRVFSKPKDFPFNARFDLVLKQSSLLGGDFSVRLPTTTVKGSLVDLDVASGKGELTLLTNKFQLDGWTKLLSSWSDYELSGSAKVLVNWKGNLARLDQAERMLNLTLENVAFLSPAGRGIRNANVLFDMSPLVLKIRETTLEIGASPIRVEAEIYNPQSENPQVTVNLLAPRLEPFSVLEHLKAVKRLSKSTWRVVRRAEAWMRRFIPKSIVVEELVFNLQGEPGRLRLQPLLFRALEGEFELRGEMDWPSDKPEFWYEIKVDRMSLARYFEALDSSKKVLEGNLFFNGRFEEKGGSGALSITNGEWHSTDLLGTVIHSERLVQNGKSIFETLAPYASGSTPFSDLRVRWTYREGKFDTGDLVLSTEDLWAEGKGSLSSEGVLNAKVDFYLSNFLTRKAFESWETSEAVGDRRLGPIPLLLVGTLTKPQGREDDRAIEEFLSAVRERKFRKILRRPF